jgi:hypothetical protein
MTNGYDSFRTAMGEGVDYTFNWFYIDADDIGYQHSCRCPQRAQGVDPYLPAWGTGPWDWQGFIPLAAQPAALNPPAGYLSSWNNKQAPQFGSNDREFSYGPVYRVDLLNTRLEAAIAAGHVDRTDVIDAMEDAGTVDLRGQEVLPLLLSALGPTAPGGSDPRVQDMRDRLAAWLTTATHRRDHDQSGEYDDPQAPAIMDAWWPRLAHAVFDAPSGDALAELRVSLDDANRRNHLGSAFNDGLYSHVNKDLRRVLGQPVADPWSRAYCGNGALAACRAALWASLETAAADLEAEFGSPNVADWKRAIADEDVRHTAVGVVSVPAIHWINRPTFQQVVQIETGACPRTPLAGCRQPVQSRKASLKYKNRTPDTRDQLVWRWGKGEATPKAAFGDPLADTDYRFCVYDGGSELIARAHAPAGELCSAGRACWRESTTGFKYSDPALTPDGVKQLQLRSGVAGKARIVLKGRGDLLDVPALPVLSLPVRAQMQNGDGECWEASYGSTLRNQETELRAKSD